MHGKKGFSRTCTIVHNNLPKGESSIACERCLHRVLTSHRSMITASLNNGPKTKTWLSSPSSSFTNPLFSLLPLFLCLLAGFEEVQGSKRHRRKMPSDNKLPSTYETYLGQSYKGWNYSCYFFLTRGIQASETISGVTLARDNVWLQKRGHLNFRV